MSALTCIGESHMACVLVAAEEAGISLNAIALKESVSREFSRAGGSTDAELETVRPGRIGRKGYGDRFEGVVCSFIGGRYPMTFTLHRHPAPFDFVLPDEPDLPIDSKAELIPARAMRAVLEGGSARQLGMFEKLVEAADGPVYQFESPPPVGRLPASKSSSAPPYVRYKLGRLYSAVVREHAERIGAHFVSRPEGAVDSNGFLLPRYAVTMTHANSAYGALVLEQMASLQ
jgi:hypothetical protein